jgi:hypothetical protein
MQKFIKPLWVFTNSEARILYPNNVPKKLDYLSKSGPVLLSKIIRKRKKKFEKKNPN